jgi:hypothetical protein
LQFFAGFCALLANAYTQQGKISNVGRIAFDGVKGAHANKSAFIYYLAYFLGEGVSGFCY